MDAAACHSSKIRERCERVWGSARARGQCAGMNPFIWRGLLSALLPKLQKLARGHYAAMPFADEARTEDSSRGSRTGIGRRQKGDRAHGSTTAVTAAGGRGMPAHEGEISA